MPISQLNAVVAGTIPLLPIHHSYFLDPTEQSSTLKSTLKAALIGSATLVGGAIGIYYASRFFGSSNAIAVQKVEKLDIDISLPHNIQSRALPILQMDLIKDRVMDINKGEKFSLQVDGKQYCQDAYLVSYSSPNPFPPWVAFSFPISTFYIPGPPSGISIKGNFAFVAARNAGLQIVDISNIYKPILISNFSTSGSARGVSVFGNLAFVAADDQGVQVVNIETVSKPYFAGKFSFSPSARGVCVAGNFAFIAAFEKGLLIVNISNISQPYLVSSYPSVIALGVYVVGNLAYAGDYTGVKIINIANISNPTLAGQILTSGYINNDFVINNFAYLVGASGLQIFNLSDKNNPYLAAKLSIQGIALGVAVINNFAIVAAREAGLQIINLSQLAISAFSTKIDQSIINLNIVCSNKIYSDSFLLSFSKPPQKKTTSLTDLSMMPFADLSFYFKGDSFFTSAITPFLSLSASLTNGLPLPSWIRFSIKPQRISTFNLVAFANNMVKIENTLFIAASGQGFLIIDVTNPENPNKIGSILTTNTQDIAIVNNTAFVASDAPTAQFNWPGLRIVNISNKALPTILGAYPIAGGAFGVAVFNDTAYVIDHVIGLQILNVKNKTNPSFIGSCKIPGIGLGLSGTALFTRVYLINNVVFTTDSSNNFYTIDVSNKSNPFLIQNTTLPPYSKKASGASFQDNMVFIPYQDQGLLIFDTSNETNPLLLGLFPTNYRIHSSAVSGKFAYLGSSIVDIIDLDNWAFTGQPTPADAGNYPIKLTAKDSIGNTAFDSFTIRVEGPPFRQHPLPDVFIKTRVSFTYFVNEDTFKDPNNDPLTYSASLANGNHLLPEWLSFNPVAQAFLGTPEKPDAGTLNIIVSAKDALFPPIQAPFNLHIIHENKAPILLNQIPTQIAFVNQPFAYSVPTNTFFDEDNDPLSYTTSLLPNWLTFNQATFKGTPLVQDANLYATRQLEITFIASDGQYTASSSFGIAINGRPPQVLNQISSQIARVNQPFNFVAPSTTFNDIDGKFTYSASYSDGQPLTNWLTFDPVSRAFKGTPGPGDTDVYTDRRLEISLKANDGTNSATTNFVIAVNGKSYVEWGVTIGAPLLSAATTIYALYRKRAYLLNHWNEKKYTKTSQTLAVGEEFSYIFSCNHRSIRKVVVKGLYQEHWFGTKIFNALDRSLLCCRRDMKEWIPVPNDIPSWLKFNANSGTISSQNGGPEEMDIGLIRVQAIGNDEVILEQFDIEVVEIAAPNPVFSAESQAFATADQSVSEGYWEPTDLGAGVVAMRNLV